ncbi:MAG: hypothetical protein OIF57_04600 [Marinobacterium sp.]|nr:hypothetical protein [Marinobacterium sp.]
MKHTLFTPRQSRQTAQLAQHTQARLTHLGNRIRGLSTKRQAQLITEFIGGMKGAARFNPQQSLVAVEVLEMLLIEPAERPNEKALSPPSNQGPVDSRRDQPC